jgi:glycosyltransferase involved in cell wall biosynthesis
MHIVPLPLEIPADLPPREQMRAAARARFDIPADAPTVVFMGRLHHVKRIELAMEAVAEASKTAPGVHLLLLGDGESEYVAGLKAQAERLGIAKRVRFAGFISGEDKWPALAAGDVLTLNSKHENFGFVAVEALAVGTPPVMTSNLALAPELAGVNGGISCEASSGALARAYLDAINLADRPGLVARGMAWVAHHLSAEAVGSSLARVYRAASQVST